MNEQVLVIIKPDGMRRKIAGSVLDMFMAADLHLIGLKTVAVTAPLARRHYRHLRDQFFFKEIVDYLSGKIHDNLPVVAMVFSGQDAIAKCRNIAGATNPEEAVATSVRGRWGRITTKGLFENLVHVSSSKEEAAREIKLWFKKKELIKT